ncbi:kinase-like domain-containing protein [Zopfochytrium polystomum]|nr:kinase-like domain-containing protein [Zopfochytrium polystomum]
MLLKSLSEANPDRIVGFRHFYLNEENIFCLIMDKAACTVADVLSQRKTLTEPEAKIVIRACLEALVPVHKKYFVHRDIKPQNLFLFNASDLNSLKLGDFGVSVEENGYSNVGGMKGTKGYMAPEVMRKTLYGRPIDIWSTGVVAFELLVGSLPQYQAKVVESKFHATITKEDKLSPDAKAFIQTLLQVDPSKRPTAAKALEHPWLDIPVRRPSAQPQPVFPQQQQTAPPPIQVIPEKLENFEGWVKLHQANGPAYYFHEKSGVTQWHHPGEQPGPPPAWANPYEAQAQPGPAANIVSKPLPDSPHRSMTAPGTAFAAPPRGVSTVVQPKRLESDPTAGPASPPHQPVPVSPQGRLAPDPVSTSAARTPSPNRKVRFIQMEVDPDSPTEAYQQPLPLTAGSTHTANEADTSVYVTPDNSIDSAANDADSVLAVVEAMAAPTLPRTDHNLSEVPYVAPTAPQEGKRISIITTGANAGRVFDSPNTISTTGQGPKHPPDLDLNSSDQASTPTATVVLQDLIQSRFGSSPTSSASGSRANSTDSFPAGAPPARVLPPSKLSSVATVGEEGMSEKPTGLPAITTTLEPSTSESKSVETGKSPVSPQKPAVSPSGFLGGMFTYLTGIPTTRSTSITPASPAAAAAEAVGQAKAPPSPPSVESSVSESKPDEPKSDGIVVPTPTKTSNAADATSPISQTIGPPPLASSDVPTDLPAPGVPGWNMVTLPAGAVYFYDVASKETRWYLPGQTATSPFDDLPPPPAPPPRTSRSAPSTTPNSRAARTTPTPTGSRTSPTTPKQWTSPAAAVPVSSTTRSSSKVPVGSTPTPRSAPTSPPGKTSAAASGTKAATGRARVTSTGSVFGRDTVMPDKKGK